MRTTTQRMFKTLPILAALLTGCAQYAGVTQPVSPTPVYPPMYDVQPLKRLIQQTQIEALKLEEFVNNSDGLLRLQWSLERYKFAAKDLYYDIQTAPAAQISYQPWQTTQSQ